MRRFLSNYFDLLFILFHFWRSAVLGHNIGIRGISLCPSHADIERNVVVRELNKDCLYEKSKAVFMTLDYGLCVCA